MPYTVGLTGGIASGKSAVAACFEALGVEVIDADQVARAVVEPGTAGLRALVSVFGEEILDASGGMDRRRMRERVFNNPEARRVLEGILHPHIRRMLLARRDAVESVYGILMVPLFARFGLRAEVQRVLVVDTPESEQISRAVSRDGMTVALAQQMLAAQESRAERLALADDVIDNRGALADLPKLVCGLHELYAQMAAGGPTAPPQRLP